MIFFCSSLLFCCLHRTALSDQRLVAELATLSSVLGFSVAVFFFFLHFMSSVLLSSSDCAVRPTVIGVATFSSVVVFSVAAVLVAVVVFFC